MKNFKTPFVVMILSIFWIFYMGGNLKAQDRPVNTETYPSLGEKEMGNLRWILKLADQLPGDWSGMGGREPGQETMESYRYQLAFMTYFLAVLQYHKTPAYRELYQKAMDTLIQKMLRKDVWYFWEDISKGRKVFNPDMKVQGPGWKDPVISKNIMYSGHLLHMVNLYAMLYNDMKYDEPGSLTFHWNRGLKFVYDNSSLAEVIYKQYLRMPIGIECEVNLVFPECNQHPILGLILYDFLHGTRYSQEARSLWKKSFYERGFIDPETHRAMRHYMIQQDRVVPASSPAADGWTGAFMHAWDPDYIEGHYPYQQKASVVWQSDGTALLPDELWNGGGMGYSYFAILAKEVGDIRTAEGILRWADKNISAVNENGLYYFPRNDEHRFIALSNILLSLARVNIERGLWTLHNKPWSEDFFRQPYISHIDYPDVLVKQAIYDVKKECLIVTVEPGKEKQGSNAFMVQNLDPSKSYLIQKDGKVAGSLKQGVLRTYEGVNMAWTDGSLEINTHLEVPQTYVVKSVK